MAELNPFGIQVDGAPFWNGVHQGLVDAPVSRLGKIWRALEEAYEKRGDVDPVKLRDSRGRVRGRERWPRST